MATLIAKVWSPASTSVAVTPFTDKMFVVFSDPSAANMSPFWASLALDPRFRRVDVQLCAVETWRPVFNDFTGRGSVITVFDTVTAMPCKQHFEILWETLFLNKYRPGCIVYVQWRSLYQNVSTVYCFSMSFSVLTSTRSLTLVSFFF